MEEETFTNYFTKIESQFETPKKEQDFTKFTKIQ